VKDQYPLSSLRAPPAKRAKITNDLVPVVFAILNTRLGKESTKRISVLLDSGASSSVIHKDLVRKLRMTKTSPTTWNTAAGPLNTSEQVDIEFALPELSPSATIKATVHVHPAKITRYDMIIGRDMLTELGIDVLFSTSTIEWGRMNASIPMKPYDFVLNEDVYIAESEGVEADTERLSSILDAKYAPTDVQAFAEEQKHLSAEERTALLQLLTEYETLFDGTLGQWTGKPYHIELRPDAKPYHGRPYSIPKAFEQTLKLELDRLVKIGVLKKVNRSEWAFPSFIIPKKDQTVRFINDLRELNKRIRRVPFPLPKIQDLLLKMEGFTYATALDLNMGYYHIRLDDASKRLCTLIFPWGKYEMQCLPMGLCNSPDIFQEKMSELMEGLEYVRAYIDDLLIISKGSYEEHLQDVSRVLGRLQAAGLKVNANKSSFARSELEYLGYWITREGIQPQPKKIQAMLNIAPPTNKSALRSFIGMVNYYRDAWIRRSDVLAPLAALCGKNAKWNWTDVHQKSFDTMKRIISRDVLLAYPDFSKKFEIYTDASDKQLGAVITQAGRPIAYYSRKLNTAQLNYTTTEKELLAIVETLKEFRSILLGQVIVVYTDHKNLTYKVFNTQRVMRWRLIIEEYGPTLEYVKGEKNVVADALSRLDLSPSLATESNPSVLEQPTTRQLAEAFALTKEDFNNKCPLTLKSLMREQQKDNKLIKRARDSSTLTLRSFHGGGKVRQLIVEHDKIVVPASLQRPIVEWYHTLLCHPGETRMENTIAQHLTWTGLRKTVHDVCKKCDTCQRTKRTKKKYGHLPAKEAETIPWDTLCVDLIGPYNITQKKSKRPLTLWAVTMIDPATGWFEIASINTKRADVIANIVEQTWFTRYPWPSQVILDRGTEFMAEFTNMLESEYGITKKPITKRNPQANSIIERVHQTLGNMIRTFSVQDMDEENPWQGILSAVAFAIRATVHSTTRATPSQLIFGRDAIFQVQHIADWQYIKQRKQQMINANNARENAKRIDYKYRVGQRVLIKAEQGAKYGTDSYLGPYIVTAVNDNGTLRVNEGAVTDTYNIRNVTPYTE